MLLKGLAGVVLCLGCSSGLVFGQAGPPTHRAVLIRYTAASYSFCSSAARVEGPGGDFAAGTTLKLTNQRACVGAETRMEFTVGAPLSLETGRLDPATLDVTFADPPLVTATMKADLAFPRARGTSAGVAIPSYDTPRLGGMCDVEFNQVNRAFQGTTSFTITNDCRRNPVRRVTGDFTLYSYASAAPLPELDVVGAQNPSVYIEIAAVYRIEPLPMDDLMVTHVHPVQAIQTPQEHVTLIGGKQTVARVFVKSIGTNARDIAGVNAVLRCVGSDGRPYEARGGRTITALKMAAPPAAGSTPNLAEESVNIVVPKACTTAGTAPSIEAAPVLPAGVQDQQPNNDKLTRNMVFVEAPGSKPFRIGYMRIFYRPPGAPDGTRPTDARVNTMDHFLKLTYPVPDDGVRYFPLTVDYPTWTRRLITGNEWQTLLNDLNATVTLMDLPEGEEFDQVIGWLPYIAGAELGGRADAKWGGGAGLVTLVYDAGEPFNSRTLAHELGHNLGLRHTNEKVIAAGCPVKAPDDETAWPFDGPQVQTYGIFQPTGAVLTPGLFDFMSYCPRSTHWVSPYSFEALIAGNLQPVAGLPKQIVFGGLKLAAEDRPAPPRRVERDVWLVTGTVRRDSSSGRLDSFLRVRSSRPVAEAEAGGTHCLQFSGTGGALGSHCFTQAFRDADGNVLDERSFVRLIPVVEGATRVALTAGSVELATLSMSGAVNVTITSPQAGDRWDGGGARTIAWSSSAGSTARYAVQYSPDGGTSWQALAANVGAMELRVDPSQLQGGENVRFRVLAGVGLDTGSAEVGPIAIVQTPRLEVPAAAVELHNAVVAQGIERTFEVKNPGTGPLRITAITPSGAELEVLSPGLPGIVPAGESLPVTVRFLPSAVGEYAGTLRFESNDAAAPSVVVNLRGRGIATATPEVAVTPAAVTFGNVSVGGSETRELTITNFGPALLQVGSANATGPFTVVGFTPLMVAANESVKVAVRFTPVSAGAAAGTLTLNTNDPAVQFSVAVALTGTGLATDDARLPKPGVGGVVHGASFTPALARGTLASVFGTNLANGTVAVSAAPWPVTLGGTQVIIGGIAAPLYFVSAGQINFQVPFEVALGPVPVLVVRDGFVSVSQVVTITENAPGVFTYARTAEALDPIVIHANGQLVTPDNPAVAGEIVIVFLTGMGSLTVQPVSGDVAPFDALAQSSVTPVVTLGGAPVEVLFAGLSPGFIGLGQMNLKLPATLPAGRLLEIAIGGDKAVAVNLAVR